MPLLQELEEDVGLLWFYVRVPELINGQHVHVRQRLQESAGGPIRQGCIHLIEQILRLNEQRPIAILHGFARQRDHQAGLADTGLADEHNVLGLGDKFQLRERADQALLDALLLLEGEGLQGPGLFEVGAVDARFQGLFLSRVPLCAKQLQNFPSSDPPNFLR
jgi:hypothetical protein